MHFLKRPQQDLCFSSTQMGYFVQLCSLKNNTVDIYFSHSSGSRKCWRSVKFDLVIRSSHRWMWWLMTGIRAPYYPCLIWTNLLQCTRDIEGALQNIWRSLWLTPAWKPKPPDHCSCLPSRGWASLIPPITSHNTSSCAYPSHRAAFLLQHLLGTLQLHAAVRGRRRRERRVRLAEPQWWSVQIKCGGLNN